MVVLEIKGDMNYIIYKITNLINGKVYIGKTTRTIEKRWQEHCYCKDNDLLHNAIRKYAGGNKKWILNSK